MSGDPIGFGGCGCHVGAWWGVTPPPMCDYHRYHYAAQTYPSANTFTLPTIPTKLSDEDIESIARRVAELLKPAPISVEVGAFDGDSPSEQARKARAIVAKALDAKYLDDAP